MEAVKKTVKSEKRPGDAISLQPPHGKACRRENDQGRPVEKQDIVLLAEEKIHHKLTIAHIQNQITEKTDDSQKVKKETKNKGVRS